MNQTEHPDFYAILGVDVSASTSQIKAAFRKAAKANHPDQTGDDEYAASRFRTYQQAYEVLSDPAKRAAYDRERAAASSAAAGTQPETDGSSPSGPARPTSPKWLFGSFLIAP